MIACVENSNTSTNIPQKSDQGSQYPSANIPKKSDRGSQYACINIILTIIVIRIVIIIITAAGSLLMEMDPLGLTIKSLVYNYD